ncbi:MAG TPA: hypothetical protein VMQ45_07620 [Burkholderiaceae bacterium]|nr:hypothetical protein [Burkholderiaceae bacterium]
MGEFESPTYFLDLKDGLTRARIHGAEVGKPIKVRVRQEQQPTAPAITAEGVRSADGLFTVTVTSERGTQSHDWTWGNLMAAIASEHEQARKQRR